MKRYLALVALSGFASTVFAQGYVGAVRSLTNVGFECPTNASCDKSDKGLKFYGGTKLPSYMALDAGFIRLESIEVSYMRFGRATVSGETKDLVSYSYEQELATGDPFLVRTVPVRHTAQADALSLAVVARAPIVDQFSLSAKLGLAYVSSTYRTEVDGRTDSSQTKSKIKPYIGLGLEYDIPSVVKLVGTFDMTKFDAAGYSGSMRMIGLGAEKSF